MAKDFLNMKSHSPADAKLLMGGLAHFPILIFIVNFIKGKFESIASKVVEIKEEEIKEEEVKSEELNASEFKEAE